MQVLVGKWRVRRKIYTSMAHFEVRKDKYFVQLELQTWAHDNIISKFISKKYDIEWNQSIALRITSKAYLEWQMLEKSEVVPKEYGKNLVQVN
jgi:hypothetical protein